MAPLRAVGTALCPSPATPTIQRRNCACAGVYGCIVANAQPELREWVESRAATNERLSLFQASEPGPGGIVQALHHFGCA